MPLKDSILTLARSWLERQGNWKNSALELRKNNSPKITDSLEPNLIYPVVPSQPDGSYTAIDGGIIVEEFHGLDVVVYRSLAANFCYEKAKLHSHGYFPSAHPEFEIGAKSGLEQYDRLQYTSLIRLGSELSCAIGSLEKFSPKCLFLDGSIAPLLADKPPSDSELMPEYENVVNLYSSLYKKCSEKNTNLIGIMKDSRARRFLQILSSAKLASGLEHSSDTLFLDYMLKQNERTFTFRYSASPAKNQVLKDLGDWASKILSFYIKPVEGDRPLRIEFLSNSGASYDEVASIVCGLCSLNKNYAYPAVLIEADLRAAISPQEAEHEIAELRARLGKNNPLMPLRRNSRPFR